MDQKLQCKNHKKVILPTITSSKCKTQKTFVKNGNATEINGGKILKVKPHNSIDCYAVGSKLHRAEY